MKLAEIRKLAWLTEDLAEAITRADRPGLQYAAIFGRRRVRNRPLIRPRHGVANRDLDRIRAEGELDDVDRNFLALDAAVGSAVVLLQCGTAVGLGRGLSSGRGGARGDR